jgi:hypothetical protein
MKEFVISTKIVLYKDHMVRAATIAEALEVGRETLESLTNLSTEELDKQYIDSDVKIIGVAEVL